MVTACATDACDGPGCDCAAHFMTPEEELAANAAVVWNECADAVGPEDAEGALTWAEQLGRVTATVLSEETAVQVDGPTCAEALRLDVARGLLNWRNCVCVSAAATAATSADEIRALASLVEDVVQLLGTAACPDAPFGGADALRIFACKALSELLTAHDKHCPDDPPVVGEAALRTVLPLFRDLLTVEAATPAGRAFLENAFPDFEAPVVTVACRAVRCLLDNGRAALVPGDLVPELAGVAEALLPGTPRDPDGAAPDADAVWVPDAAAILDALARNGHTAFFLDERRFATRAPRSLIGRLVPYAPSARVPLSLGNTATRAL